MSEPGIPRELVERFIEAAEKYRIYSELWPGAPIELTVDMLKARNALFAVLYPCPEKTK